MLQETEKAFSQSKVLERTSFIKKGLNNLCEGVSLLTLYFYLVSLSLHDRES